MQLLHTSRRLVLSVFDFDNETDDDFLGQIEMELKDVVKASFLIDIEHGYICHCKLILEQFPWKCRFFSTSGKSLCVRVCRWM